MLFRSHVLADGGGKRRGYWHSTCRAARLDKAGVVPQEAWLDRFGRRMRGIYLSDRLGAQGEQAPGLGEVNFGQVKPYLGQDTVRVLSISDDDSTSKLKFGAEYLSEVGIF